MHKQVMERLSQGASFNWKLGRFESFSPSGTMRCIVRTGNDGAIGYAMQEYMKSCLYSEDMTMSFEVKDKSVSIYF